MYGFLLVFFSNFVPKMHRFWDIRLVSIPWPWNPGWGSLKVIGNYSLWQVVLCAAVGAVRTDVVHTGGIPAMQTNMWMDGKKLDWLTRTFLWEIVNSSWLLFIALVEEETHNPSNANKYWKETSVMLKIRNTVFNYKQNYSTNVQMIVIVRERLRC